MNACKTPLAPANAPWREQTQCHVPVGRPTRCSDKCKACLLGENQQDQISVPGARSTCPSGKCNIHRARTNVPLECECMERSIGACKHSCGKQMFLGHDQCVPLAKTNAPRARPKCCLFRKNNKSSGKCNFPLVRTKESLWRMQVSHGREELFLWGAHHLRIHGNVHYTCKCSSVRKQLVIPLPRPIHSSRKPNVPSISLHFRSISLILIQIDLCDSRLISIQLDLLESTRSA